MSTTPLPDPENPSPENDSPTPPPPPKADKSSMTFQRIFDSLPPFAQKAIRRARGEDVSTDLPEEEPGDEALHFEMIRRTLPDEMIDVLDACRVLPESEELWPYRPRWCLYKAVEGEFPRVTIHADLPSLIRAMAALEGQEVSVWALLGVPMRMTTLDERRGCRYLLLPGEQEVVRLPQGPADPIERMDRQGLGQAGVDFQFQEDGWMGDPSLSESNMEEYYAGQATVKKQQASQKKTPKTPPSKKDDEHDDEAGDPVED